MSRPVMSIERYATFCAPTVLAALMDCTPVEAAEYLTDNGHNCGTGGTRSWDVCLADLGGERYEPVNPEGVRKRRQALEDYWHRCRYNYPGVSMERYTVAQFLRAHPEGLWVLTSRTHTLLARNGRVVADTMSTKSQRARVVYAHRFPEGG